MRFLHNVQETITFVFGLTVFYAFNIHRYLDYSHCYQQIKLLRLDEQKPMQDTNVYEGTITSSPGPTLQRMAAISSASVQDVVNKHF